MKFTIAIFVVVASVVDGGTCSPVWIRLFILFFGPPASFLPATKIGAMISWWWPLAVALVGFVAACCSLAFPTTHTTDLSPLLQIWNPTDLSALWTSGVLKDTGGVVFVPSRRYGGRPSFDPVLMEFSGGFADGSRRLRMMVFVGCVWFGLGDFPELVSVFAGVGSRFVVVSVIWATGVGSGWCCTRLFVATGVGSGLLLLVYSQSQCNVTVYGERYGRSLDMGLSPIPKGVRSFAPSGVLKLLTVLVSSPSNGSSFVYGGTLVPLWWKNNSRWAPYHEGFTLIVYIITFSLVVFLTLTILCNVSFV